MLKLAYGLMAILGVLAAVTGLVRIIQQAAYQSYAWAALIAGIIITVLALLLDQRRQHLADVKQKHLDEQRAQSLLLDIEWGGKFQLNASPFLLPIMLLLLVLCCWWSLTGGFPSNDPNANFIRVFLTAAILPMLFTCLRMMAAFGQPSLLLDKEGIILPLNGRLFWKDIMFTSLAEFSAKGKKYYQLRFDVQAFAQSAERLHWTDKLLASLRMGSVINNKVMVPIPTRQASPHMLELLVKSLWEKSGGPDRLLATHNNPLHQQLKALDKLSNQLVEATARNDTEAVARIIAESERVSAQLKER